MSNKGCLIIRSIISFEYRNIKLLLLKDIDFYQTTLGEIKVRADKLIGNSLIKEKKHDTMKLHFNQHKAKTDLVIDTENEEFLYKEEDYEKILCVLDIEDECEISYFNYSEYCEYKKNKKHLW